MTTTPSHDYFYENWINGLNGVEIDEGELNQLKCLCESPEAEYNKQKQTVKFFLNNISVLKVDKDNDAFFYDFSFPRMTDVISDIKSTDPERVHVSVLIGGQLLENPSDPILLIAAQYHQVIVRLSFDRKNISYIREFGFEYHSLIFQPEHRRKLVQNGWKVEGRCRYKNGLACMIVE